jgi:hypothetical protein
MCGNATALKTKLLLQSKRKRGKKFVCDQSQQNKNYSLAIIKKKGQKKKRKKRGKKIQCVAMPQH